MERIVELKGVGPKTEKQLNQLQIYSIHDLLHYFPREYITYETPVEIDSIDDENAIYAIRTVIEKPLSTIRLNGKMTLQAVISNNNKTLRIYWFQAMYLKNVIRPGGEYVFRGKISLKNNQYYMFHPEIYTESEYIEKISKIFPVYSVTKGITSYTIEKLVAKALESDTLKKEFYPLNIRTKYHLCEYNYAISNIHFPSDHASLLQARSRLVFDEFFKFIMNLRSLKKKQDRLQSNVLIKDHTDIHHFFECLPFDLTNAQKNVWKDICRDMTSGFVMNRLIQGDVGSGKTIIAFGALLLACMNHFQGALMAPTEVLARQHMEGLCELIQQQNLPVKAALLTGSMTAKEKRTVKEAIRNGTVDIIIGTHTLIQEDIDFHNLALVITDEQHRFGVKQRETLFDKGLNPHVLVMSATPIPRTLAIILYGDLDISVLDEMPANRIPIKNCVVTSNYRKTAYRFMQEEIKKGHQVYIICAMVDENDTLEIENVISYEKELKKHISPDIRTAVLHGKMKPSEKNKIMEAYLKNEIQILVSTTVVEVGVNVPNATVMMIENAERFGLAQLHQLRGRVGRGSAQSYCIFVSDSKSKTTIKRLETLNKSNDGFFIANEDLKLRGPGDLFGLRQSGLLEFKIGDIYTDAKILQSANEAVNDLLSEDPNLEAPEHQMLKHYLLSNEYHISNNLSI